MATQGNPQTGREHEVGVLTAPLLTLDLSRRIEQLRSEGRWQSGHTARTLAKYPDLRVVLIVVKAGGRLEKHHAEGRISVQALDGRVRFNTAERSVELEAGQMLTLERGIPHDVEGIVDSAFLLTIAWHDPVAAEMLKTFKRGDHVEWTLEAGRVGGTVMKKVISGVTFNGYTPPCATKEQPQYFIESDNTITRNSLRLSASAFEIICHNGIGREHTKSEYKQLGGLKIGRCTSIALCFTPGLRRSTPQWIWQPGESMDRQSLGNEQEHGDFVMASSLGFEIIPRERSASLPRLADD